MFITKLISVGHSGFALGRGSLLGIAVLTELKNVIAGIKLQM